MTNESEIYYSVKRFCRFLFLPVLMFLASLGGAFAEETGFPREELEQMERYEVSRLQQADRAFNQKDYRQAEAGYEAFILEFSQSRALAYAVLRKGRSLHLDNKRFEAIRVYQDVVDYFPNQVRYAGAALYHIGQAHMQNGNPGQAVRVWTRMANDPEYQEHPLAARALTELANHLVRNGEADKAMPFYLKVIENFRRSNLHAARDAWGSVLQHAVRRKPDESLFRQVYQVSRGFHHHPSDIPEDLEQDQDYWNQVISQVYHQGRFNHDQQAEQAAYYQYWAEQLEGRFSDWDRAGLAWAEFLRRMDGDDARWIERLDTIYAAGEATPDRTLRWMELLKDHSEEVKAYYERLEAGGMGVDEHYRAQLTLAESKVDDQIVVTAFQEVGSVQFTDAQLLQLIERYRRRGIVAAIEHAASRMDDSDRGRLEILRHHLSQRQTEAGLALADQLLDSPNHADAALWLKGRILEEAGRYEDAIAAYRQSGDLVARFWHIARCYEAMKEIESAVRTLREAEQVLENQSPEAVWRIAQIYRRTGEEARQQQVLRQLLDRYPDSNRSRDAHLELERMGVTDLGGGIDTN